MNYVARVICRSGEVRDLTYEDYRGLRLAEYAWVLDGLAEPPVCLRDEKRIELKPAEFIALAKLVRTPGAALKPRGELLESTSQGSAIRRFEEARVKVEPGRLRGGESFRTIGDEPNRRYSFNPDPHLDYCLIERLDPPMPVQRHEGIVCVLPAQWAFPDLSALQLRVTLGASAEPREPALRLIPRRTLAVGGVTVVVDRFSLVRGYVRARVTVSNAASEPRVVGFFTLHVGEISRRAVRHLPRSRRRVGPRGAACLKPEMLVVGARRAVKGLLFFRRLPLVSTAEAELRPHLLRTMSGD